MSPWIGPGPHDRHLDHQVVELAGLQARQHRHLRPALHLEHAHRIGLAQHLVDRRILSGACRPCRRRSAAVVRHQHGRSPRFMAVSMPSASTSTFIRLQVVDVVLVPLDEGAVGHGRVADRHGFVQPPLGQHEAADVLRQVAREAQQLGGQGRGAADLQVVRIEPTWRMWSSGRPSPQLPQTVPARAAVTSSVRPSALPTSRMALRGR